MNSIYKKLSNHLIQNQDKFYRLSYTYLRNENDALDIVQNAILKALEKYKDIKNIEEYKSAFIQTGGTEEEFKAKNIVVDVSYDVKSESANHLSMILNANENLVNAHNVSYFYNINLNTGENISLKDILGEDYINIANESIKSQIENQIKTDENVSYFGYGDNANIDGFEAITDETNFYINENGNPVVVFEKYEIATGFMGKVEFEIKNNVQK